MFEGHRYKCPDCGYFYVKTEENYGDVPSERFCLKCLGNKGKIAYAGVVGFLTRPIQDGMCEGVFCPADGKTYDSRSAFKKAVKDKGLEIVGDDAKAVAGTPNLKEIDWQRAVAETIQQVSPTN